jgi:hypothetical protein
MHAMTAKKRPSRAKEPRIEHLAVDVLSRVQAAIRGLIQSIPGMTRRPADLQRTLGIHSKLAWQVHGLAYADDPLAQAGNVPGPAAMERFVKAAIKRGAPIEAVDGVRDALHQFERMINDHAGSRGEFDSIISGLSPDGSDKVDLTRKREAFRAQSHILSIQARAQLTCFIYKASTQNPATMDCALLRGPIGVRRFRPDAKWVLTRTRLTSDDGTVRQVAGRESLDPDVEATHGVALLREFCSRPLPTLHSVPAEAGFVNVEVEGRNIGNKSEMTCLIGDVTRQAFLRYRTEIDSVHRSHTVIRTPCEVLVQDVLVHRDLLMKPDPQALIYTDHRGVDPHIPRRDIDLLPMREAVVFLGRGVSVLETPDVPRYTKMATYAFDRLGWDAEEFDVYRCRVEYPVMPSSVVVQFDLPEKP